MNEAIFYRKIALTIDMPFKEFPEFSYMRILHKEMIDKYLKQVQPKASELTFVNMFIWRRTRPLQISMLDDMLIIREMSPLGDLSYYPPITTKDPLKSTVTLIEKVIEKNEIFTIDSITEPLASQLKEAGYDVVPDRDNWDYVYRASNLGDTKCSKHASRNQLIKNVMEKYEGRCRYADIDQKLANECLELKDWREDVGWNLGRLKLIEEPYAIMESLSHFSDLDLIGGAMYVDDKLCGFVIGERIRDNMVIIHSEKVNQKRPGLHQYLNMEFVSRLPDEIKWLNMEQDLGDLGLRRAMSRYEPDHFIEKFILKVGD